MLVVTSETSIFLKDHTQDIKHRHSITEHSNSTHRAKMCTQPPWNFMVLYCTLLLGINVKLAYIIYTAGGGDVEMLLRRLDVPLFLSFPMGVISVLGAN